MTNELTSNDKANMFLFAIAIAGVCFIAAQIRGCQQDANEHIKGLASQGIRAEMSPNGNLRVIDTRDFRASKEEGK